MGALTIIERNLVARQSDLAAILPPHVLPGRVIRVVMQACRLNPRLAEADGQSIINSTISACVLGLEPDGVMGLGYLVPFKGRAQFMCGYRGYVTLASQSGYALGATLVHEHDAFEYEEGTSPKIYHKPDPRLLERDRGRVAGAYAVARSHVLPSQQLVMSSHDLLEVRNRSAGYKSGKADNPWRTDVKAMFRKTPIRRLGSQLPITVDKRLLSAARMEEVAEDGHHVIIEPTGDLIIDDETVIRSNELE